MLFNERAFLDRFEAAAKAGFKAVEFLFPYAFSAADIKQRLAAHRLKLVLHNLPAGDWDAGERGIACHPDRVDEFREGVAQGHRIRDRAGRAAAQLPGRQGAGRRRPRRCCGAPSSPTCACRGRVEARRPEAADRADQHLRHPRLLPDAHGPGAFDPGRGRCRQCLRAVRHLPRAAHGRRTGQHVEQAPGAHRPYPAGRQPGPQRARHAARSTTLSCSPTSTASATPAASAANTSPPPPPKQAWAG